MDNIYPKCSICQEVPLNGLFDGIRLNGKLICTACEKQILRSQMGTPNYDQNMSNIRKILYG